MSEPEPTVHRKKRTVINLVPPRATPDVFVQPVSNEPTLKVEKSQTQPSGDSIEIAPIIRAVKRYGKMMSALGTLKAIKSVELLKDKIIELEINDPAATALKTYADEQLLKLRTEFKEGYKA